MSSENRQLAGPPPQIRWAGGLVGVQGLLGVGAAVGVVLSSPTAAGSGPAGSAWAGGGWFLLMGAALVAVAVGLVRGRRWARTPAIVTQLLLLPVVYSLIGPSQQLLWGIAAGLVVLSCFLLLISEPARTWSMGWSEPDPPDPATD